MRAAENMEVASDGALSVEDASGGNTPLSWAGSVNSSTGSPILRRSFDPFDGISWNRPTTVDLKLTEQQCIYGCYW